MDNMDIEEMEEIRQNIRLLHDQISQVFEALEDLVQDLREMRSLFGVREAELLNKKIRELMHLFEHLCDGRDSDEFGDGAIVLREHILEGNGHMDLVLRDDPNEDDF